MDHKPCPSKAILPLIAALLVLPISISVLVAVSALLVAMGDATGGVVVKYVALSCGILWLVGLICLVLLQGFYALTEAHRGGHGRFAGEGPAQRAAVARMLNHVLDTVGQLGCWAYAVVFLVVFLQCAAVLGFLVPGEAMAVFSGFLAGQGVLQTFVAMAVVAAAAIGGNLAGYYLGRRLHGPWILRHGGRFGVHAEHLQRVEQFFSRHGGKTVLLGRLSPLLRALVPFVAGASRLRFRSFVFYTVLGGLLWAAATVTLGYLAGASWQYVEHWLGGLATLALAAVVLGVLLLWTWRRRLR